MLNIFYYNKLNVNRLIVVFLWLIIFMNINGCDKYDDSAIKDLQSRMANLEQLCNHFNTNIVSLQSLALAVDNADMITCIDSIYEDNKLIGYKISFYKANPIIIYHGNNDKTCSLNTDSVMPIIGIAKESDGYWYWTLNGAWLLNSENEKIRAENIVIDDDNKGVFIPRMKIGEDEFWYLSIDGGITWKKLVKVINDYGKDGDIFFDDVYCHEDSVYFVLKGGYTITLSATLSEQISLLRDEINVEHYESIGNADFWLLDATTYSDHTWVGNCFVGIMGSSDDLSTDTGWIDIHVFDNGYVANNVRQARTAFYRLKHFWGHCNTIDYNAGNDCLILGNGSGNYRLTGKIIIIPNFSSVVNDVNSNDITLSLSDVNALVIDCADYNLGSKFNLIWGDDNDNNYNIAYLITANIFGSVSSNGGDLETIRKIVFRKGKDEGQYGSFVINATPFNGTFDIVEIYYQKTSGYANCIQGACYYKGEIFAAIGHDGAWYWRMRMNDGKIYRREYKQHSYHDDVYKNYGNSTGICVKDGYMFLGRYGLGIMAFKL